MVELRLSWRTIPFGGRMKKSLLASASFGAIALATGAQAAAAGARPVYQASVPPAPWSWSGFYIGGTVGAAGERSTISNNPLAAAVLPGLVTARQTGVIGGLEAGYNAQVSNIVVGIEGDISWASLNRSVSTTDVIVGGPDTYSSRLDNLSTFRGRLGWAIDRTLFYGTGGVAFADLKDQFFYPSASFGPFTANPNSNVTGWVAGAGIEYALWDHWTVKAEYLHVGLPNRTAVDTAGNGYAFDFKDSLDIGRVGINYKF